MAETKSEAGKPCPIALPPISEIPATTRASFTVAGTPINVYALRTGTVTIKKAHATCCLPESVPYPFRFASILLDWRFAEPLPVYCYAIEHPDGIFIIDTGAHPNYNEPTAWGDNEPRRKLVHSFIKLDIDDESKLSSRLEQVGLNLENVKACILTHQHVDHTGAVPDFPTADIWTAQAEDEAAGKIGALHFLWRNEETKIKYVDVEGTPPDEPSQSPGLGAVVSIADGIDIVHTPGHTPGSLSVLLKSDQGEVWFSGDTAFSLDAFDASKPTAGIHFCMRQVRQLHDTIPKRAALILPSHDWNVDQYLKTASLDELHKLR